MIATERQTPLAPFMEVPNALLCVLDLHGKIIELSQGWETALGYSIAEFKRMGLDPLVHPDDMLTSSHQWNQLLRDGQSSGLKNRIMRADGSYRLFQWSAKFDPESGLVYSIAWALDSFVAPVPTVDDKVRKFSLTSTTPNFYYLFDLTTLSILYSTPMIQDVLGYTPEELRTIGGSILQKLVHPEDWFALEKSRRAVLNSADDGVVEAEYRIRHADGSWRWIWNRHAVYARDADGTPTQSVGNAYDVTARREREEAYRLLFESNPNPMWVLDIETLSFLAVNDMAVKCYGYSRDEFLSMSLPDVSNADAESIAELVSEGDSQAGLYTHRLKDGNEISVEIVSHSLTFMGHRAILMLAVDVTEKQEALRMVHETKETLETIIASAPVAIISVDSDGVLQTWNPEAEQMFRLTAEEAIGQRLSRLGARRYAALTDIEDRILHGEDIRNRRLTIRRRDGAKIDLEVAASPLTLEDGTFCGSMAIVIDVTEKLSNQKELQTLNKQLERRVSERTAELLMSNQELEAFCFSVSHDLRAPLRAIDGFSRAVLLDSSDKLNPTAISHLNRVRKATHRMSELIDALLSLTRLTRAEIRREWIDLTAIGQEVASDLQASEPDRWVIFDIDPHLKAYADPRLMRLLLDNLLGNAFKFTNQVEDAQIIFGFRDGAYYVADNGAGFDMAYANRLFQPFERLHANSEFPGNGIGLATAHRVVSRHGGTIRAEGKVGEGATVTFTISNGD